MVHNCKKTFKTEFALLFYGVKADQARAMRLWLNSVS
jgi:hypothetical protein